MCRFISYLGQSVLMDDILSKPKNSLIQQSISAQELDQPTNADGFGVGWYNHEVSDEPGLFKSIQPAWNDSNLLDIFAKIKSDCFFGHVRRATAGSVTKMNCHPFRYQNFLMMHNGGIRDFANIKRQLRKSLSDEAYQWIKGHTDTEHLYAIFTDKIKQQTNNDVHAMEKALTETVKTVLNLQREYNNNNAVMLNLVVTNGKELCAVRYSTATDKPASSLHYCIGSQYEFKDGKSHMHQSQGANKAIIVSSERLNDEINTWHDIEPGQILLVDQSMNICLKNFIR